MARSIWSGAISFGLVNVPVKLYTAVRAHRIPFNLLHAEDGTRLTQKRVCPNPDHGDGGKEVSWDEVAKGYEIAPDQYVKIEQEELDELDPKASRTIEIEEFVELADIDPVFFDHPYYLAPDRNASKAYRLLVEAMAESGKVAIGRFVMRTKEYLAAIRADDGLLVISTMRFADEVADRHEVEVPTDDVEVSDKELKLAKQLIDSLTDKFEPDRYHDEYRERVRELIERKAEGKEIAVQPTAEEPERVVDLMAALEESLEKAKAGRKSA